MFHSLDDGALHERLYKERQGPRERWQGKNQERHWKSGQIWGDPKEDNRVDSLVADTKKHSARHAARSDTSRQTVGLLQCRSKCCGREDRRDELRVIREFDRGELSIVCVRTTQRVQ